MDKVYINTTVPANSLSVVARLLSQSAADMWSVDPMFVDGEFADMRDAGVTLWREDEKIEIQFHDVEWDRSLAARVYAITKLYDLPFSFGQVDGFGHYTTYSEETPDPIDPRIIGVLRAFTKARS